MINDIKDITSFKWATVTGVNPLAIRLDGDPAALALIPDSLIDPLSLGVGARVRVELSLRKCVIHGAANGSDSFDSGDIMATARATARTGWMLCQGQSLLRSAYPRLFAAIGTTYGATDSTHFSLPNLKGRVIVGVDPGDTQFDTVGEVGGAKTHTLTVNEIPAIVPYVVTPAGGAYYWNGNSGQPDRANLGGGAPHNNLQPYAAMHYMIKL